MLSLFNEVLERMLDYFIIYWSRLGLSCTACRLVLQTDSLNQGHLVVDWAASIICNVWKFHRGLLEVRPIILIAVRGPWFILRLNHVLYLSIDSEIWSCRHVIWGISLPWWKCIHIWNWARFLLHINQHLPLFDLFLYHLLNADLSVFERFTVQILSSQDRFGLLSHHGVSPSRPNFLSIGGPSVAARSISNSWRRFELLITSAQILVLLKFFRDVWP